MISGFLELDYLDLFMPCPQFGLNISPRENEIYAALGDDYNVGDISRDTIQGRGILVDLSLLLPRAVYFKNVSTTWENLGFLLHSLFHISITHCEVQIESLDISLLLELKRPPPRHLGSVLSLFIKARTLLRNAQPQAKQQAHCLFSSPKYAKQNPVMLIAAAGEWWIFLEWSRQDFQQLGAFPIPNTSW